MRKWMRDRNRRRNRPGSNPEDKTNKEQQQAPLQPTFLDREGGNWSGEPQGAEREAVPQQKQPEYEAQPETDPTDAVEAGASDERPMRRDRTRRRGRGGKGRSRQRGGEQAAEKGPPVLPIVPGQATGEAAELEGVPPAEALPAEPAAAAPVAQVKRGKVKGAVVLAIGLPGSGKSSWFRRHNIIPLSSDLIRGLLFDDPTEQRFQDLVFSSLRSLLRARMIAGRPMNYIDATNLSPKERHSWIKMARDFGYEAHAVFFDVPTETCMERNRKRSRNVPDEIMVRMGNKLRPPKFEEGFAKITIVRLKKQEKADEPSETDSAEEPEVPETPEGLGSQSEE